MFAGDVDPDGEFKHGVLPPLVGRNARVGFFKLREPHLQDLPRGDPPGAVLFQEHQLLRIRQAGGNHHFPTRFELVDQGRRNEIRSCRDDHFVEGSMLRPAMIAVGDLDLNVAAALPAQSLLCFSGMLYTCRASCARIAAW